MQSKTCHIRIRAAEVDQKATELRLAGWSYRAIGAELGVSGKTAYKAVTRSLARTRAETAESAELLRQIEQERLERLISAADNKAQNGDISAIEVVRKLSESLRKLNGLDAPAKTDITTNGKDISWRDFIGGDSEPSSE